LLQKFRKHIVKVCISLSIYVQNMRPSYQILHIHIIINHLHQKINISNDIKILYKHIFKKIFEYHTPLN